ncbi:MAG: ATP-binding cassette domain-containing protein [Chloroflexi bacterium]|nr:MAG: ATP-binding cassette domain-containing protein [Chloroflexota bacterium]
MLELQKVTVQYGGFTAVEDITFEVPAGQFVAVVGPTGCGKSSLLNLVAGLLAPAQGSVRTGARPVNAVNRDCSDTTRNLQDGGQEPGAPVVGAGRTHRVRRPLPAPAVRRTAEAGGDGSGARESSAHPVDGRALQRAGRPDARPHGAGVVGALAGAAGHGPVRDARSGGGDRAVRSRAVADRWTSLAAQGRPRG